MKKVNIDQLVADELLRLHFKGGAIGTLIGGAMAIPLGLYFVYPYAGVYYLIFWYILIFLFYCIIQLTYSSLKKNKIQETNKKRWITLNSVSNYGFASTWSVGFLIAAANGTSEPNLAVILTAVALAWIPALSTPYFNFYVLWSFILIIPLAVHYLLANVEYGNALGIALIFFWLGALPVSKTFCRTWADSIRLRFENKDLLQETQELLEIQKKQSIREKQRLEWLENITRFLRHEVKNSLTGAKTSVELMKREFAITNDNKYLNRTNHSLGLVAWHLNKVADATSLEKAIAEETNEIINLTACITEQCETYKTIYPHKSILFSNKVGNVDINASYFRICQLLDKLVNNAVDFADDDTPIEIILNKVDDSVSIQVVNQGPALPDNTEQLFTLLYTSRSRTQQQGNIGLGLYVVKLIVEQLGGSISARNRSNGQGAIFEITLPLVNASSQGVNDSISVI